MSSTQQNVEWNLFDRGSETKISARDLPHWDQCALTFVTFRLDDSMPRAVVQRWKDEQQQWIRAEGLEPTDIDELLTRPDVPGPIRRRLLKFRHTRWHEYLDRCHGSCVLRRPELARIVADTLLRFEGERYDLERFVVMPNHVHLLGQMRFGWDLRNQCTGWMRYSANQINRLLHRKGAVWQSEPFDHIVRNENQCRYLQKYTLDNPKKAGLLPGQYLIWTRQSGFLYDA